jgi:hypothetical protein
MAPPKRRFTYGLHGAVSKKMATFVEEVCSSETSINCHQSTRYHTQKMVLFMVVAVAVVIIKQRRDLLCTGHD